MTFQQDLAASFPIVNSSNPEGVGLTVSLLKALNHATFLLATAPADRTEEFIDSELTSIVQHLDVDHLLLPPAASDRFRTAMTAMHRAGLSLANECSEWEEDELTRNMTDFTARIFAICAEIDRELGGIVQAQSGTRL